MPTPPISDTADDAFERLFRRTYRPVLAYARRRSSVDADDVVSEVFRIAWARVGDIPPGAELPWLYGVARGVIANHRRGDERRRHLVRRIEPVSPAPALEPQTGEGRVAALVASLRPLDREVLTLVAWEGLTGLELATALGCTPGAAAVRLHRARRRFRAALDAADQTHPPPTPSDPADRPEVHRHV